MEARDGYRAEQGGVEAQSGEVFRAALVGKGGIDIWQERGALFQRAGLRLLQSFVRELNAGAAFGGNGHVDSALEAQFHGVGGNGQSRREEKQVGYSH